MLDSELLLRAWAEIRRRGRVKVSDLRRLLSAPEEKLTEILSSLYEAGVIDYEREGSETYVKERKSALGLLPCIVCPNLPSCSIWETQKSPRKCVRFMNWLRKATA